MLAKLSHIYPCEGITVDVEVRLKPAIGGKLQWSRVRHVTMFEVFGIC
jgi:hypothetical protein